MKQNLTRLMLFSAICLLCVSTAMATTTCPSGGLTTYASYDPAPPGIGPSITCSTNNLTFSNFNFENAGATGGAITPTPSTIGVTVLDTLGNEGFSFNPAFNEASGQSQDATVTFEVSGIGGTLISDLFIGFNGIASGTGSTSFSEEYCTDGFGVGTCNIFSVTNPPTSLNLEIPITPTSHLFIIKDFVATAGTNGSASISQVQNRFSNVVPEPRQIGLMILGMIGLVLAHRKFRTSVG